MQACASELIGFLTSVMSSSVIDQGKRTMQVPDLLEALKCTGLDSMVPLLEEYHKKYSVARESRKKNKWNKTGSASLVKGGQKIPSSRMDSSASQSATSGSQSPIINYLKRDKQRMSTAGVQ